MPQSGICARRRERAEQEARHHDDQRGDGAEHGGDLAVLDGGTGGTSLLQHGKWRRLVACAERATRSLAEVGGAHLRIARAALGVAAHRDLARVHHVAARWPAAARGWRSARPAGSSCRAAWMSSTTSKILSTMIGDRPIDGSSISSTFGPRHQRAAHRQHLLLAAATSCRRAGCGAPSGAGRSPNTLLDVGVDLRCRRARTRPSAGSR